MLVSVLSDSYNLMSLKIFWICSIAIQLTDVPSEKAMKAQKDFFIGDKSLEINSQKFWVSLWSSL